MTDVFDTISRDYVALAFGLEQHIPGFVDAYTGPAEVRTALEAAEPATPEGLLEQATALRDQITAADLPHSRRAYLQAQVGAMLAICDKLTGATLAYADEVRRCFDIPAEMTPESAFDDAIRELDDALPGAGEVAERMTAWEQRFEVSPETAQQTLEVIVPEIRRRTAAFVDLPEGESIEFTLVSDKPWSGYNWYLGNARSRVEINTDLPIRINDLTWLVCHEAYPGHHTEHALKERHLFREQGWGEFSVQLISTPQAVISEGIATLAESIVFPGNERITWQNVVLYPAAGVTGDVKRETRIETAQRIMRALSGNAALLLHSHGQSEDDVAAYLRRYGLLTEQQARHRLRFLTDPLWRAYVFTYHAGRDLLGQWLDAAPAEQRQARFRQLLMEPTTPSGILAELGH